MKFLTIILTFSVLLGGAALAQDQKDNRPGRPLGAPMKKLLSEIDARELPNDYEGGEEHQPWVDRMMAKLDDERRGRVGELWKEKERIDPKMPNKGGSFVKILAFVAGGKNAEPKNKNPLVIRSRLARTFVQLAGQEPGERGSIQGRVHDASGKAMEGVMISAFAEKQEVSTSVFSQADGSFVIEGLRDVPYRVRARLIGQLDDWNEEVKLGSSLEFALEPATGLALQKQRPADSTFGMLKWDSLRDKENLKMMCMYCHQVGTVGFRTPEKPVDWETMLMRMDGFGGLYRHTQKTLLKRLLETYSDEAIAKWPPYEAPPAPTGLATQARITEWDIGKPLDANVHDIEPGPDGLMYAVDMSQNAIVTLNPETGERIVYRMPNGSGGPHSIELANDGNMWVTLCGSGHMGKFDLKTKEITIFSSAEAPAKRGSYPHTLRINPKDPEGLIWYTDAGRNSVFSIHPETGFVKEYPLLDKDQAVAAGKGESRGLTPYGLDFSPIDGMVWFSKLNANRIGRIDPNAPDGKIKEWNPPFRGPRRLHVAQDGIVWVPGFGSGVLGRFDPKTEEWIVYALPNAENQIPYALNIDSKGYIWICGTGDDTLNRFDPKTEMLVQFRMPTRVTYTREIEFDQDGAIWTSNSQSPTRHIERGRGSVIKLELLKDVPGGGVKLKRVELEHHLKEYVRKVAWHKSKQGKLLQRLSKARIPAEYPGGKQHQAWVDKRMAAMTEEQRGRLGRIWSEWRRIDPNMDDVGGSFVKVLDFVAQDGR